MNKFEQLPLLLSLLTIKLWSQFKNTYNFA